MSGPLTIWALRFQVETYRDLGIVLHWPIKIKTKLAEKKFEVALEVIVERR